MPSGRSASCSYGNSVSIWRPNGVATTLNPMRTSPPLGCMVLGTSMTPMVTDIYRPVDLSAYCNAGVELLDGDQAPPLGNQVFHGLPFRIGDASKAFVAFGADLHRAPVTIPIRATAYSVIVAHRLLGSQLATGAPVGNTVATYVFKLADGTEQNVPIRERFEIADLGRWGQLPFLARPDQKNGLQERWSGPWSAAGFRQTEVTQGAPRAYYLWTWRNPAPNVAVDSL